MSYGIGYNGAMLNNTTGFAHIGVVDYGNNMKMIQGTIKIKLGIKSKNKNSTGNK
ncbi:MAG: hypothetical protein ACI9QD_000195 [Thermoproteota archaeon]|jgi:hypothetical protein